MKRRKFLKISSLVTLPVLLKSCDWVGESHDFPIIVHTDIHTGHLVFQSNNFPQEEGQYTETLELLV